MGDPEILFSIGRTPNERIALIRRWSNGGAPVYRVIYYPICEVEFVGAAVPSDDARERVARQHGLFKEVMIDSIDRLFEKIMEKAIEDANLGGETNGDGSGIE